VTDSALPDPWLAGAPKPPLFGRSLCARASPLGLLSEQIDSTSGELTGNFPQAFSHIGVIASGVNLARAAGTPR
jgi:hypothetical protein